MDECGELDDSPYLCHKWIWIFFCFSYANLKIFFETDGKFDINKDIFGSNMGPSNDDFTIGSIIECGVKRHGYYIG